MASSHSSSSENEPDYQEAADDDDEEDDEDYDPNADVEVEYEEEGDYRLALAASQYYDPDYLRFLESHRTFAARVREVEVLEVPSSGEQEEDDEEDDQEEEKTAISGKGKSEGSNGLGKGSGVELDRSSSPNCPICFEPWTSDGVHRVSCIPCGHVYGRSCLEKWLQRCRNKTVQCPQCNRKFKQKEIINLYAPQIVVPNDDLEKELHSLRETNEFLRLENSRLQEEIKKQRMHSVDSEGSGRQKMSRVEHASSGTMQRRLFEYFGERQATSAQTLSENRFLSQNVNRDGSHHCNFVLQHEFVVDGARVMGIDASNCILIISGKAPGLSGDHVLTKISLLVSNEMDKIQLPPQTGAIRDVCILSDGLALLASLGKKLSLFSMASNNCVLKYDLPSPAWSCSGDFNSPYHVYAGLQNGMLLMFDLRQTARSLDAMEGLSRHPVHTIHSLVRSDNTRKVLTASSLGPCVWDAGSTGERPYLVPGMGNQGVCISLACGNSSDDIVVSYRPKVELSNNTMSSQASVSPSPTSSGSGRLGSHVLIKRDNGVSYQRHSFAYGHVSEVRMSKSAIISTEGNTRLFAYGDESSHGVCLWNLPSLQVYNHLKPHQHAILDLKYARATGPGFLGSVSEDRCQIFSCF